jgi:streptogrisin D
MRAQEQQVAERVLASHKLLGPRNILNSYGPKACAWMSSRFLYWKGALPAQMSSLVHKIANLPPDYVTCTTGFAVRKSNGVEGLISARHCGPNYDWFTPFGDRFVGHSASGNQDIDTIVLTGADYSPVVYDGPWDSTTGLLVGGKGNPANGSFVAVSGAYRGYRVVKVTHVNLFEIVDGVYRGPGFWTLDQQYLGSVGEGDSGGPVLTYAYGSMRATARGMIDLVDTSYTTTCIGKPGGTGCSARAFHINITNLLTAAQLTIQTQ